jgi:hypothetical protein
MIQLPSRWRSESNARRQITHQLRTRHMLRLHSFMLFLWTMLIAVAAARIAFSFGCQSLILRYMITCTVGYAAFVCGVAIWLRHVETIESMRIRDAFEAAPIDAGQMLAEVAEGAIESSGEIVGALGEGLGAAAGEGCIPILIIGALVAIGAILVGSLGPELLIDIAFEAMLAGSLVGFMRLGREPDWLLRLIKKTIVAFLLITGAMLMFGRYAHQHYPEAKTTREVFRQMKAKH